MVRVNATQIHNIILFSLREQLKYKICRKLIKMKDLLLRKWPRFSKDNAGSMFPFMSWSHFWFPNVSVYRRVSVYMRHKTRGEAWEKKKDLRKGCVGGNTLHESGKEGRQWDREEDWGWTPLIMPKYVWKCHEEICYFLCELKNLACSA